MLFYPAVEKPLFGAFKASPPVWVTVLSAIEDSQIVKTEALNCSNVSPRHADYHFVQVSSLLCKVLKFKDACHQKKIRIRVSDDAEKRDQ